jgi:hypothetical protein
MAFSQIKKLECDAINAFGVSRLVYNKTNKQIETVTNYWIRQNFPLAYINHENGDLNNSRVTEIVYKAGGDYIAIKFYEVVRTSGRKRPALLAKLNIPGLYGPFHGKHYTEIAQMLCELQF